VTDRAPGSRTALAGPDSIEPGLARQATTVDLLLGGRFAVVQPARGHHRAGLDALLLAAALPEGAAGRLADLGAGVGTAGFAAAARHADLDVTLVEREPLLAALARAALALPENAGFGARVAVVEADVTAGGRARLAAGLAPASFDHVLMNPPFFSPREMRASPAAGRAGAHMLPDGGLDAWIRTAAALARPHGRLALVFKGDGLADILAALKGRFGAALVHPVCPRAGEPATRLVVTAEKGRRTPPRVMPGLVLHPPGSSRYLPAAEAILNGERGLSEPGACAAGRN
jgi:tRNA1(Val) A37 N6-methylase TrmN6